MSQPKPNIVVFFTDDQRFDTIHALGNDRIRTPVMDSLVASGTAFVNAGIMGGTSGAVCMPSRAMLMSGRTLFSLEKQGQNIPADHTLLGEALQGAGYQTFGTGKWHNGKSAYARSFTDGAEIFFGGMGDHWNVPAYDYDPTGKYDSTCPRCPNPWGSNELEQRNGDHIIGGKHSSELFCEAAMDYLDRCDDDKPFFMYISFMAPHDPRTMPSEYLQMYDPADIELPPNFMMTHPFNNGELRIRDELLAPFPRLPDEIKRHIAEYYAMITHADAQIGRVIDKLKAKGCFENTVIVFAGDNGLAVGRHGLMGKQSNYEHSIRVPLILSGPGIPAGQRSEAFCYLLDIYPTLCELIGAAIPDSVEGKSLVPALQDPQAKIRELMHYAYTDKHRAVRDAQYKLIEYVVEGKRTTQLFDWHEDPWELNNLAEDASCADTVARLRQELRRWQTEYGDVTEMGRTFWSAWDD